MQYRFLVDGRWIETGEWLQVTDKYSGEAYASLPLSRQEVDLAITAAARAAAVMAEMPAYKRWEILQCMHNPFAPDVRGG